MTSTLLTRLVVGLLLSLLQGAAALPWVLVLLPGSRKAWLKRSDFWFYALGGVLVVGLLLAGAQVLFGDPDTLEALGRVYGSVLHAQLVAVFFVGVFALVLLVWPKGGAVALAAFREGIRQPMFFLLVGFALFFMIAIPFLPYYTFGEDYLMVKDLGQDILMLFALIFGAILASTSISEEIEGRTAVTLMSKPVSRRQFLLGKYFGILLAALVVTGILSWFFNWMLLYKHWYDQVDPVPFPAALGDFFQSRAPALQSQALLRGASRWLLDTADVLPGLVMGFCQVTVLLAVAVALATRLPVAANVVTCAVVYVVSNLNPILLAIAANRAAQERRLAGEASAGTQMLEFASNAFNWLLPGLQLFKPVQITDAPIALGDMAGYAARVVIYTLLYAAIPLLFGLVLFEDRDLA
jgi:ABC-type transport system involved in multi-copper enzyme maturation permease subunit